MKTKKSGDGAEENQEKRGESGGKLRKARLERRKTKKSEIWAEEKQEKWN